MKYATERKIIHHGGAYGSLNAQQSIISNRTRMRDALFGPSDDGASNGTNESIYGGLAHIMEFIGAAYPTLESVNRVLRSFIRR